MSHVKHKTPLFNKKLMEEKEYWLEKLTHEFGSSNLRPDNERTTTDAAAGRATFETTIPADVADWLTKLTGTSALLLYTALHASLKICLYKYSGSRAVVVGSPPRRKEDHTRQTPNALAILDHIDDTQPFRQFLFDVRQTLLEAYARQSYPYEQLVKQLKLDKTDSASPLFNVVLSLSGFHDSLPDLKNDITISVTPVADELKAVFDFNSDAFHQETIQRLSQHWTTVLRAASENLDTPLRRLELLTPAERHQLLVEWNDPTTYTTDATLPEIFERQAERTPAAVALVFEDQQLTYAELDARANQLARRLRAKGVAAESLVGLYVERSPEMIVGLLGILKAGGAYVPLDPSYPRERLSFIIQDAGVQVLLMHSSLEALQPPTPINVVYLDRADETEQHNDAQAAATPPPHINAEHAAYVIYTSGSTGTPKGVVVTHANVNRLLQASEELYHFDGDDVWTLFHSFAFDFSVWEIWGALAYGGRLVIVPYLTTRAPEAFLELLRRERVTVLNQTPSAFAQLMRAEHSITHDSPPAETNDASLSLRLVIFGGEALDASALHAWFARHGDERPQLVNMYGITETTVHVTSHAVTAAESRRATHASIIGKPISDLRLYILDGALNLVPVGIAGEIFVGGAGVARGYLNRSTLTAERFVPDPFSTEAGARLYRTGDRAQRRADGDIEFAGRADQQVKIRGFRIELGEIEATLDQHPTVLDALVVAQENPQGDRRLIAYVVPQPDYILNSNELRQYLQERLPDYMLPTAYVVLDALPLTPSGKVDRRALPSVEMTRAGVESAYASPETEVEEVLVDIWKQVLGVDEVGIHDNFFELGGHSLLATQIMARVRETLGVEVAMRTLFEQPTVHEMAVSVERLQSATGGTANEATLIPASTRQPDTPLPLSYGQQRLWFIHQLQPDSPLYHIPLALRLSGSLNLPALQLALQEIIRRHEVLRTRFALDDSLPVQLISPPDEAARLLPLQLIDLSTLPPAERDAQAHQLTRQQAVHPFDLSTGPLVRATLLRLTDAEHLLLWTMHHIVSDGWSLAILVREVATLYGAYIEGQGSPLIPLPIQYADYAVWQREWLTEAVLAEQLSYWRHRLGRSDGAVLELPTDRARPAIQTHRGAAHRFTLSPELSAELQKLSQQHGVTLFMTLLAAFQTLLYRYTGEEAISVGTPIANRTRREVEGLIGFFVNTLVMRTEMGGEPTFVELMGRVKEACLGAYAHQDVPFEKLVEELQPERSLSHTPLFQVMMSLQNAPQEELRLGEVGVEVEETEMEMAKFDVTLTIDEEGASGSLRGVMEYNAELFEAETIERMCGHWTRLLEEAVRDASQRIGEMEMMGAVERERVLGEWSGRDSVEGEGGSEERRERERGANERGSGVSVVEMFEEQVRERGAEIAVIGEGEAASYRELNERANRLGRYLRRKGVGREEKVGVMLERGVEMMVGLMGVLKAGGAYVPMDASYPAHRLAFMLEDSKVKIVLTQAGMLALLDGYEGEIVCLDTMSEEINREDGSNLESLVAPENIAYVIYTSGSTGQPKGVMVSHQNVVNFFDGMDACFHDGTPGTWLAVTSISFDISVLELFWTLARGFSVVVQREAYEAAQDVTASVAVSDEVAGKDMDFSLFYFASDEEESDTDRYRLLLEGAKFADRNGFTAVWTPERHFHAFGGLYPNPSITSAAIATITERVQIRAGSVVMPLHHPVRVAEEWSVVDNLSKGRAAISFASGWHADDFVFAPENYADRKEIMLRDIETVRRLWRGEALTTRGGAGNELEVRIRPRPVQPELPVWLTAAGNPETFETAGEIGAHVLTHLVGQSLEELQEKIGIYREAWRRRGHRGDGYVSLMLHTFVGLNLDAVKESVRAPLTTYIKNSADLIRKMAQSFGQNFIADDLSDEDRDALLEQAFERYFETNGLLGTPGACLRMVERLKRVGVDEVACLIDFGVPTDAVLASLPYLHLVAEQSRKDGARRRRGDENYSLPSLIKQHNVTHLQCTPSMARIIGADAASLKALGSLRKLMLGGEALPVALAQHLRTVVGGDIYNMYGPTETTIWSATHRVDEVDNTVPLGRPITNTQTYILDRRLQPLPAGVPGELYIGGAGVVRGYLGRPDLTAEKFVPDPFGDVPGARLYKTGDLTRFRADGNIEFLGRLDRQVKLRGYRIELGEIEAAISRYAGVREAAVNVREDASGEKRLVAYVVTNHEPDAQTFAPVDTVPTVSVPSHMLDAEQSPDAGRYSSLPNGMVVSHVSAIHAHAAYQEIFEENSYLKHGIALNDGDTVFDVGANIGMFTLFVNQRCRNAKVYAFEPIPAIFDVLHANVKHHGVDAVLYECGISDRSGESAFTFYPELPGLSGRYSDPEKNKETARALIFQNGAVPGHLTETLADDELEEALNQRYRSESFQCRLKTLSEVIEENKVERIDLLKVDVEKSELDVLNGIRAQDWPKIKQIVLEVETRELLHEISALLERHDFDAVVDEAIGVDGGGNGGGVHVYMLYAMRRGEGRGLQREHEAAAHVPSRPTSNGHQPSVVELRNYLKERLPEYAVPSAFVFLKALPLTPNGKINYQALPDPQLHGQTTDRETSFIAPRTEMEQIIAGVWQELLHVEKVGIHENFFDRGGHSLLALHVRNRLQERLGRELSIVNLFKYPTIDALAKYLSEGQTAEQPRREETQERAARQKQAINRQKQLGKARKKKNEQ